MLNQFNVFEVISEYLKTSELSSTMATVGSKIIRALEIIRLKKLITNSVL